MRSMSSFFFFQAEDGIRDVAVTGVQTCALPIFVTNIASGRGKSLYERTYCARGQMENHIKSYKRHLAALVQPGDGQPVPPVPARRGVLAGLGARSEERRVGKESRPGWSPWPSMK